MSTSLEPASSIIGRFGGPVRVQEITGASRTRVYRWTQPEEKGGTGGIIPFRQAEKLLGYARENGIRISADDFMRKGSA